MKRWTCAGAAGVLATALATLLMPPMSEAREVLEKRVIQGDTLYQVLPRDAFVALDHPEGTPLSEVGDRVHKDEPILGVVIEGEAKAYSTWLLERHELVNDVVGGVDIAAAW